MTPEFVIELGQRTVLTTLLVCAPLLGFGLLIGLIISIFQAVTQIQEMTLTFVPKIVVVLLTIVIFGQWMLNIMLQFTRDIFSNLPFFMR
jgi:flagellar biosynthesis protein FliQ